MRVRAQGRFDIAPQLVLRVVLLERVSLCSDPILIGGELLALAFVAEHDADDQHLARQGEGALERLVAFPRILDDVEHEAEVDHVGRSPFGRGPEHRIPALSGDSHLGE